MTEWTVFLIIGEVVALFLLVGMPIIKLNSTIVSAVAQLKALRHEQEQHKSDYREFTRKSEETHEDFRTHLEKHDLDIQDHEFRLKILEKN